jgi:hypothetical protein
MNDETAINILQQANAKKVKEFFFLIFDLFGVFRCLIV